MHLEKFYFSVCVDDTGNVKNFSLHEIFDYVTTRVRREGTKGDKRFYLIDYDELIIDLIILFCETHLTSFNMFY